ncbi:MAG: ribonuclease III [Acidobacteria bacterium]|nr:ribonuclease III [Acidobacteriota bacterium]
MEQGLEKLEERIGHAFKDRSLLLRALTHSSFANECPLEQGDNEQLEFLGDTIIGFVVGEYLMVNHPDFSEGRLSKLRAQLVSSGSLFRSASALQLGRFLRLGKGAEKSGSREKQAVLVDATEALVAALYLDGGMDAARRFVLKQLEEDLEDIRSGRFVSCDYKSRLQEKLHSLRQAPPEYSIIDESGPGHRRQFSVRLTIGGEPAARGQGATKKSAEQDAARQVLERVEPQPTSGAFCKIPQVVE